MQQAVAHGIQSAGEMPARRAWHSWYGRRRRGERDGQLPAESAAVHEPNLSFNQQPVQQPQQPVQQAAPAEDPYEKLIKMKQLLDAGVLTQEEFDQAKAKILGV
jgi:membrane protease subunit (stomatin/prohibitin family)